MPKIIDHDERKDIILDHAMELFKEVGLKETSLSLIAERSGINRPILYLYFTDKHQIYEYAVKKLTDNFFKTFIGFVEKKDLSYSDKLDNIFLYLMNLLKTEDALLSSLTEFFFEFKLDRNEKGFTPHLKRRTIQFRRLLHKLILDGEKNGDFIEGSSKKASVIFSMMFAFVVQVAMFGKETKPHLAEVGLAYLSSLKTKNYKN